MSDAVILVARHAAVDAPGLCYGQSDVPVRVDPDAACAVLLDQLAHVAVPVVRVWTSPWARTREPASRVAAALGVPLVVDARLSELAFGSWEGRLYTELEREASFAAWMSAWRDAAPPGGEHLAELVERVRSWRREVVTRGEAVLAVTHAGVIRALRAEVRGGDYAAMLREPVEPLRVERIVAG